MPKIYFLCLLTLICCNSIFSQVSINNNGKAPDSSAMLDVTSSNKGFLPPRMAHNAILGIKSPATGLIVYDSTLKKLVYYNGSEWNFYTEACNSCKVVSAESKGAIADFNVITNTGTDNSDAIQKAIEEVRAAGGGTVLLPAGKIKITKPILLYARITLMGCGKELTQLYKIGSATSTIESIKAPGRILSDNYKVNSFISIVHPFNDHAYETKIFGIGMIGDFANPAEYGIYAPRTTRLQVSDVYGVNAKYGFLTYDSWLGKVENAIFEAADYGISFSDDGEGQGTGTSMTITNVWAVNAKIKGFHIYGLAYSSFRNIANDGFNPSGADISGTWGAGCYAFHVCHAITIAGIGLEESRGAGLFIDNSTVDISGGHGLHMRGFDNSRFSAFIFMTDGAYLTLTNINIPEITENRNRFFNIVVQNNSRLIVNNSFLPRGGPGNNILVLNNSEIIENSTFFNRDGKLFKVSLEPVK